MYRDLIYLTAPQVWAGVNLKQYLPRCQQRQYFITSSEENTAKQSLITGAYITQNVQRLVFAIDSLQLNYNHKSSR